jgi:hypothetical protein
MLGQWVCWCGFIVKDADGANCPNCGRGDHDGPDFEPSAERRGVMTTEFRGDVVEVVPGTPLYDYFIARAGESRSARRRRRRGLTN